MLHLSKRGILTKTKTMKFFLLLSPIVILACNQGNSNVKETDKEKEQLTFAAKTDPVDSIFFGDWQTSFTDNYPESELKMITTIFWQFRSDNTGNETLTIKSTSTANNTSTSFTINFPFRWKLDYTTSEKKNIRFSYGLGSLINPASSMIEGYEPKENIDFANDLIKSQNNKLIVSEYSISPGILSIKNNPNKKETLKFELLPSTKNCDISLLQSRIEKESEDRLLGIFVLWKYHKLELLQYEKSSEELGQKIRYYLDNNQKTRAVDEVNKMIDKINKSNEAFLNKTKVSEVERLQELVYCYNLQGLNMYSGLKEILNSSLSKDQTLEKMIDYFKSGTYEDNKQMLAISTELLRLDNLFQLSTIRIKD